MTSQRQRLVVGVLGIELECEHFGRDKTLSKVSERYYWMGMVEDVKEFCKTCDKCQRANRCVSTNPPHNYVYP